MRRNYHNWSTDRKLLNFHLKPKAFPETPFIEMEPLDFHWKPKAFCRTPADFHWTIENYNLNECKKLGVSNENLRFSNKKSEGSRRDLREKGVSDQYNDDDFLPD